MADSKEECKEDDKDDLFSNDGNFLERFKKMEEEKKKKEEQSKKLPPPGPTIPMRRKAMKPHPFGIKKPKVSSIDDTSSLAVQSQDITRQQEESDYDHSQSSTGGVNKPKRKSRWGEPLSEDAKLMASAINSFDRPSMEERVVKVRQQIIEQQELHKATLQIQKATQGHSGTSLLDKELKSLDSTQKEHLLRAKEMESTYEKSRELTEANVGKHFIGDFLPSDEFTKFIERTKTAKESSIISDYSDSKLTESNIGFKMLQKAGWKEGEGLGAKEDGITAPINHGSVPGDHRGVGMGSTNDVKPEDDEYDVYRKRMMLAYRFRPNPLNNPRRPYY